jgi:hypothetical protein
LRFCRELGLLMSTRVAIFRFAIDHE